MGSAAPRVAVVGSGVAGLTAAHVLTRSGRHVTLFEADERLGGHADTHVVDTPDGPVAIDTGFIVHNERTYPVLLRLFDELGVATQDSEMSMSVRCDATGIEYAGALGVRGLVPARRAATPAHLRMLAEIPLFHRRARRVLDAPYDDRTLARFLDDGGFSARFRSHFMESLVACVWSCDPALALQYPARYLFRFLDHHGMLQVFGSPQWRTVTGGSKQYVDRVADGLAEVLTGTKVVEVREADGGARGSDTGGSDTGGSDPGAGVEITDGNGEVRSFDAVVIATHPGQALAMLGDPTAAQREVLGAMPYSANSALLHTDTSVLPRSPRARASWNYLRRPGPVTVTYDLTRLMRLRPDWASRTEPRYLVTLGGADLVDPSKVLDRMEYAHPLYTPDSVAAQARLGEIDTERITFAGAYHGWGFHEDGARSGLAAANRLGAEWPEAEWPVPRAAVARPPHLGAYDTTIRHTRRTPFRRTFTHRSHTWLVDLDALPRKGFQARDHIGHPDRSLRENVTALLAEHDLTLPPDGRVLLATGRRSLGHCFNPISVFWCFDGAGGAGVAGAAGTGTTLLACVVEVHNTYGDRHAYVVRPDDRGRARVPKAMYVSPFHGTDGWYDIAVPVPGERLFVSVELHTDDGAVFSASLTGEPSRSGRLRRVGSTLRGSALIRLHGITLWARRLPIRPRPEHRPGSSTGPDRSSS